MKEAEAIEAICLRWKTSWDVLQPTIPYTFDNDAFNAVPGFARVTVQHTTSQQHTLGAPSSRRFERRGNIMVQLFGDVDVGRKALSTLVADVRTTLEAQAINAASGGEPLTTQAAATREVPSTGRWYAFIVVIPFIYYETR